MKVFDFFGSYSIFNGILNIFPNIGLAASVRLLDKNYTGGLVRVRAWDGSADQGQADVMPYKIGSDSWVDMNSLLTNLDTNSINRGLTTTSTLADLVDVGGDNYDGLVPKINDQTGNGNDYIQTIAARQGRLINGGVMNLLNGKPVILRSVDNNGGYLSQFNTNINQIDKDYYFVGNNDGKTSCMSGPESGQFWWSYISQNGSTSTSVNGNYRKSNEFLNGNSFTYVNRGDVYNSALNQFLLRNKYDFVSSGNIQKKALGYNFDNPFNLGMYSFQEELTWLDSSDSVAKENNINNSFNVF